MPALALPDRPMAAENDPKTKTVRVPADLAMMLQTVSSMKDEMGERFKPVEYLAEMLRPLRALHAETVDRYTAWTKENRKKGR